MILFLTTKNSSCITRNKQSYRPSNGFDNIDGANYDLSLWVAYYNFLRPHEHAGYKVLNKVEKLEGASNMPGKWQLLIFLGQQRMFKILICRADVIVCNLSDAPTFLHCS